MFLICNGILAFLAKSSSVSCNLPFSGSDLIQAHQSEAKPMNSDIISTQDIALPKREEEEEEGDKPEELKGESLRREKGKNEELNAKDEVKEEQNDAQFLLKQDEQDYREGDEGNCEDLASTEELNKRIEEFIRKMKEEIRIEAQRQIVVV
ncbi:hypothetical protein JCGZ_19389 [Jatropha curcas]|uniref:Uncharacterized protein n=1 Tax=Jatropha curcas TaxID=180498 RepID=A0A067JZA5_JATCU|nr:glutamic acid-rich protein [Jatropha curcas]KDP29286.1 hypothetical protein JCGZ_19389 [Jatropha curcas]